MTLSAKRDRLLQLIGGFPRCVVALSGGVDSAVVAKGAVLALGAKAEAFTADSASVPEGEVALATEIARHIGIRHRVVKTSEFSNPDYIRNDADRCYHCKTELYGQIQRAAAEVGESIVLNGANFDDQGDHRPGMVAAREHGVRSPLLECGFTKADVRELAAEWDLPVWDKPASPCLSSRVAYGLEVTPQRLAMIDHAEQFLKELGLREVRVRYHHGDIARIEVPSASFAIFADETIRREMARRFRSLGFRYVAIDLEGFRSGSLNEVLPVESLQVLR